MKNNDIVSCTFEAQCFASKSGVCQVIIPSASPRTVKAIVIRSISHTLKQKCILEIQYLMWNKEEHYFLAKETVVLVNGKRMHSTLMMETTEPSGSEYLD